jgi:hypothetical protein
MIYAANYRGISGFPKRAPAGRVGETYDAEFRTDAPQELVLGFYLPGPKLHTTETLVFTAPKALP